MKSNFVSIALIVVSTVMVVAASAHTDTTTITRFTLTNGAEIEGTILSEDSDQIIVLSTAGVEMKINKNLIAERKTIQAMLYKGEYIRSDPNKTRLFFAPTARTLRQGKGYFSVYEIFLPFIAYGVTDYITLSGGMTLLPGIPIEYQLKYFAPKLRIINEDKFSLSSGLLWMALKDVSASIVYGVGTYGDYPFSFSAGLGFGYAEGNFTEKPFAMIGLEYQLSNNVKLLSENWVFPEVDGAVISFGIRFFGENLAADFGFFTQSEIIGEGSFPFLPWIGFAYNF
ncbi:MAG: hypothetical protein FJ213_02955 [Ignavibacteria bacterium]|nr:hypothetical protein [Ignavibacteria bacterium]